MRVRMRQHEGERVSQTSRLWHAVCNLLGEACAPRGPVEVRRWRTCPDAASPLWRGASGRGVFRPL